MHPSGRHSTQEDPIGLAGGMNLYGYAAGDPVNNSDPFGLTPACLVVPIPCVAAVVGAGRVAYGLYKMAQAIAPTYGEAADALEARRTVGNGGRFDAATSREGEAANRAANGGSFQCEDCGEDFDANPAKARKDHNVPWKGGQNPDNSLSNLRYRCDRCNSAKSDLTPEQWAIKRDAMLKQPSDATAVRPPTSQ